MFSKRGFLLHLPRQWETSLKLTWTYPCKRLERCVNVFIISEKIGHWRTFSIVKWRVFIISEKIGHSGERYRSGNEEWVNVFIISEKIGYSGERFRSGNEWMYSSFQRRLITLENVFDWEMNCECIHHIREDWLGYSGECFRSGNELWMHSSFERRLVRLLWRTFSIRKWRVFIISEKIG